MICSYKCKIVLLVMRKGPLKWFFVWKTKCISMPFHVKCISLMYHVSHWNLYLLPWNKHNRKKIYIFFSIDDLCKILGYKKNVANRFWKTTFATDVCCAGLNLFQLAEAVITTSKGRHKGWFLSWTLIDIANLIS